MKHLRNFTKASVMLLTMAMLPLVPAMSQAAEQAPPQERPRDAKICLSCHKKSEPGTLRGNFDTVAMKSQTFQLKIDNNTELLRFDKQTLKLITPPEGKDLEAQMRAIKKGSEVRVEYAEKGGQKFASALSVKPPLKVAPEKLVSTAELEKLVALGPENGKYTLVDARPSPRFLEGAIPTAINIPYPAFQKMLDKLPKDKNALLIFYCSGVT